MHLQDVLHFSFFFYVRVLDMESILNIFWFNCHDYHKTGRFLFYQYELFKEVLLCSQEYMYGNTCTFIQKVSMF
jgi:hypothetical protein